MIVINCQSLKSKKAEFGEFIDTHSPDVIFGSESWLSPSIHTSEIILMFADEIEVMDLVEYFWHVIINLLVEQSLLIQTVK